MTSPLLRYPSITCPYYADILNVLPLFYVIKALVYNYCCCSLDCMILPCPPPLRLEPSSNQVKEAVNTAPVDKWREKLPIPLQRQIYAEANMLRELGYPQ